MSPSLGFGTGPFGTEPFGSPAEFVEINSMLIKPSMRVLIELHLNSSFPWNLTDSTSTTQVLEDGTGNVPPLRICTEDLYPGGALGGVLFERRLTQSNVELRTGLVNEMNGLQRIESIQFEVDNSDGSLNLFFTKEMRGKQVLVHLYDKNTAELSQNVFAGQIAAFTFNLHRVSIMATSFDVALLKEKVPKAKTTRDVFPKVQEPNVPIPFGMGVGQKIPGRYVKARTAAGDPSDYDYCFITGNCGFVRVWREDRADTVTSADFVKLHRTYKQNGRFCTALRFAVPMIAAGSDEFTNITADIKRIYPDVDEWVLGEWKWDLGPESDVVLGMTATYNGNLTDANRAADVIATDDIPNGFGAGCVNFPGTAVGDFITLPGNTSKLQKGTFEFDVNLGSSDDAIDASLIFGGPSTVVSKTPATARGWWVELDKDVSGPRLHLYTKLDDGGLENCYCPVTYSATGYTDWHRVTVRFYDGSWKIMANEDFTNQGTTTDAGKKILYDTSATKDPYMHLGGDGSYQQYKGKIGWVRVSGKTRTDLYVKASSRIFHRNVMQLIRETVEQIRTIQVNESTGDYCWDEMVADIDAVETGTLKCDGYVTEEIELQEVLKNLCLFRDIRLWRNSSGYLEGAVSKAEPTTSASFGVGDAYNNIVGNITRTKLSTAEAVGVLPIEYRPKRDASGKLEGYHLRIEGYVLPIGTESAPLLLPFVWDKKSADIIRSFRCKRMATSDEQLRITVGHEGRLLAPGHKVAINLPAHGIVAPDNTYRVVAVANRITEFDLTLSPYDLNDYVYTAQTLPEDEDLDLLQALDVGTDPQIVVTTNTGYTDAIYAGDNELAAKIDVQLRSSDTVLIASNGYHEDFFPDSTPPYWEQVDDPDGQDGDTTRLNAFINTDGVAYASFGLAGLPARSINRILSVSVLVWARKVSSDGYVLPLIRFNESTVVSGDSPLTLTTGYLSISTTWTTNPVTGVAWEISDLETLEVGLKAYAAPAGSPEVRVTAVYCTVLSRLDNPKDWSVTKLWRIKSASTTMPADPDPDDDYIDCKKGMVFADGSQLDVTNPSGRYFWYARAYDSVGRPSSVIHMADDTGINVIAGSRP